MYFELAGFQSTQVVRLRQLPEGLAEEEAAGGLEGLAEEVKTLVQRHGQPLLLRVVGNSLSFSARRTTQQGGRNLKTMLSTRPEFTLSRNASGQETVGLLSMVPLDQLSAPVDPLELLRNSSDSDNSRSLDDSWTWDLPSTDSDLAVTSWVV